jgi:pimeloyl-ACP methyl ester carboxylesterase
MSKTDQVITLKDGRKLGFAEYGDPKGKPVFFFHGWPSSRLRQSDMDSAARKVKVRLISIDRPGYGLSTFKENRTILDWPNDVLELADKLGIKRFAVEGVSGGGPYAAVCAYKISKRLTKVGIVVGLAPTWIPGILNGMTWTGKLGWSSYSKFPILAYLGSFYWLIILRYIPFILPFAWGSKKDLKVFKTLPKEDKNLNKEAFKQGTKAAVQDLLLYTSEWHFDLSKINARVFLFYGEIDRAVPLAMGKYYESKIQGSILKVYPHQGHLISVTHAEDILKTLVQ